VAGVLAREFGPRGAILTMATLGLAATLALVVALRPAPPRPPDLHGGG